MFKRWFLDHPASVGETYFEHQRVASSFAIAMIGGGLACMVHSIFPALFTTTGSRTVAMLHKRMIENRVRQTNRAEVPLSPVPAGDTVTS